MDARHAPSVMRYRNGLGSGLKHAQLGRVKLGVRDMKTYIVRFILSTFSLLPYLCFAASTKIVNEFDFPEESTEKLPYRVGYIISDELEQHELSVHYQACDRTFEFDNSDLHSKLIRTSLKNAFENIYRAERRDLEDSDDLILTFGVRDDLPNGWWQSASPCHTGLDVHEIWFAYSVQIIQKGSLKRTDPAQIVGYGASPHRNNRRGLSDASEQAFLEMQINLTRFYRNNVAPVLNEIIDQSASVAEPKITPGSNSLSFPQSSIVEDLQSLVDMYEQGLLTEEQFTTAKELRLRQ